MHKKIIMIFVCMMFITIIPLSSGITVGNEYEPKAWYILSGLIIKTEFVGDLVRCFAIRLRWYKATPGDRAGGLASFQWIVFDKNVLFREWGNIHFVFRVYNGYFEVE